MKKIIIAIISAMILLPTMADAQIKVEKQNKMEKVAVISPQWYTLYYSQDNYYLSLKSTNQFDDNFFIVLGNKEEAIESMETLISLCDSLGKDDSVEFKNGAGKTYVIYKYMGGISFHQREPGMAGFTYIVKAYLKKTKAKIEEHIAK